MIGDLSAALNSSGLDIKDSPINSARLASLLERVADHTISGKIAKQVFALIWESEETVDQIIADKGLMQITDSGEIEAIVDKILLQNTDQIKQYKDGNQKVFGFFVGQVMKQTAGKANPKEVNKLLHNKLD